MVTKDDSEQGDLADSKDDSAGKKKYSVGWASEDDPIYSRGFVAGARPQKPTRPMLDESEETENNQGDRRNDLGTRAVQLLYDQWQIDEYRATWYDNGFDWWPGRFKQSIRVNDAAERDGLTSYRLVAITDCLVEAPLGDPQCQAILDQYASIAPSFAQRYEPPDLAEKLQSGNTSTKVQFVSTAWVNEESFQYLPAFFGRMAIMQPAYAEMRADLMAEHIGARPDVSTPESNSSPLEPDQMLNVVSQLYVPEGEKDSRWIGNAEFEQIADTFGRTDRCFGSGDPKGLTLETPFGSDSALIRLRTDQQHPHLGKGLLATLEIPWFPGEEEAVYAAGYYNYAESVCGTFLPVFGSWSAHSPGRGVSGPVFSAFIPNILYQPVLATNMALWMVGRANWIRETFFSDLEDLTMREILEARYALNPKG